MGQERVEFLFEAVLHFLGEGVDKVVGAFPEVLEVAEDDGEAARDGEVPCPQRLQVEPVFGRETQISLTLSCLSVCAGKKSIIRITFPFPADLKPYSRTVYR